MRRDLVMRVVSNWIKKAESDLKNIALVLPARDAPLDTVCFHAQQAAEKYIKALLTFLGIPFPKTHDLPELVLLLPADSQVRNEVGDLSELADAGVTSRYPEDIWICDRDTAQVMVNQATMVKSSVILELERRGYASPAD